MKIQVVCPMMHQTDFSNVAKLNLQTDAVIANQADTNTKTEVTENGNSILMITTDTRGVSLNRNIGISYATAEVIVFADDDQVFVDGYATMISEAFAKYPDADAIKFYCESTNPEKPLSYKNPGCWKKAARTDLTSAGVLGLAVKKEFLIKNNVRFNESIGPGKEIYCGEDSAFIVDLFRNNANIYLSPQLISYVNQADSSWFNGFNEQYFISVGYVYAIIYGYLAFLVALRRCMLMRKKTKAFSVVKMYILMVKGIAKQRKAFV